MQIGNGEWRAISTSAGTIIKFHDTGSSVPGLPFLSGANRP